MQHALPPKGTHKAWPAYEEEFVEYMVQAVSLSFPPSLSFSPSLFPFLFFPSILPHLSSAS